MKPFWILMVSFLIPVQNTWAESPRVREEDRVRKIQLQEDGKSYQVAFWNLAAIYTVPKSRTAVVRCLTDSARKSRTVRIELKPSTGEIVSCR